MLKVQQNYNPIAQPPSLNRYFGEHLEFLVSQYLYNDLNNQQLTLKFHLLYLLFLFLFFHPEFGFEEIYLMNKLQEMFEILGHHLQFKKMYYYK